MTVDKLLPKQKEIFDVSVALFVKRGYAGTSMRDIADVMKIKAASLYSHITSKEEIMDWICHDIISRFNKRRKEVLERDCSPRERFELMVQGHLNEIYKNVEQFDVFFTNIYRYDIELSNKEGYFSGVQVYITYLEKVIYDYLMTLDLSPGIDVERVIKFSVNIINNIFRWKPEKEFDKINDVKFLHHMLVHGVTGK